MTPPLQFEIAGPRGTMFLTARAQERLWSADWEARALGETALKTEHLLLAIALYDNCWEALDDALFWAAYHLRLDPERILDNIGKERRAVGKFPTGEILPASPNLTMVLEYAAEEAYLMGHLDEVTSEHLFLGIARNKQCTAAAILTSMSISSASIRETIIYLLGEMDQIPEKVLERHRGIGDGRR